MRGVTTVRMLVGQQAVTVIPWREGWRFLRALILDWEIIIVIEVDRTDDERRPMLHRNLQQFVEYSSGMEFPLWDGWEWIDTVVTPDQPHRPPPVVIHIAAGPVTP